MLFCLSLCRQLILVCITILAAASASFSGASCHVAYYGAPSGHNREGLIKLKNVCMAIAHYKYIPWHPVSWTQLLQQDMVQLKCGQLTPCS